MSQDNADTARDTIPCLPPYLDSELDAAMRELEELEAAEADARYQRQTRFYGISKAWRAALAALGFAACLALPNAANADDAPAKPKRPTMCMSGAPVSGNGLVYFVCTDGKRPRILLPYIEVEFAAEDGSSASYVLGWPAKQTKPIPLPRKLPRDEKPRKSATLKL